MNTSIFIPKRINVGFQNRNGTYTGKLAYVIYYDERGKLRKETSWNSWRDQKIPNEEFDNIPTEGFVLNKKVGDYSTGWDHRHAYCRVYDPRGFEFEITIENLLYILENTSAIKGKGLEGEFIYGWDGKDLILMPTGAPDYKEITKFNEIIHNDECIKAKDLIVGATYMTKDNEEWIYMGRFEAFKRVWSADERRYKREDVSCGNKYWFAVSRYGYYNFEQLKSIPKNKFLSCSNENCTSKYSEIYGLMERERSFSPYDETKNEYKYFSFVEFFKEHREGHIYDNYFISKYYDNKPQSFRVVKQYADHELYIIERVEKTNNGYGYLSKDFVDVVDIFPTTSETVSSYWYPDKEVKRMIPVTLKEIFDVMKPMYIQTYLKNGREYKKEYEVYE